MWRNALPPNDHLKRHCKTICGLHSVKLKTDFFSSFVENYILQLYCIRNNNVIHNSKPSKGPCFCIIFYFVLLLRWVLLYVKHVDYHCLSKKCYDYKLVIIIIVIKYGIKTNDSCLFRCSRTVSMETGCQNIQLCLVILKVAFPPQVIGPMFLFPLIYITLQCAEALLLALCFRCYQTVKPPAEGKCHSCLCVFREGGWDEGLRVQMSTCTRSASWS